MTREVCVLCRPAVAPGFGLAGLPTVVAETARQVEESMAEISQRPEVGVILVEDSLEELLSDALRKRRPGVMRISYDVTVRARGLG